ncbi:MAG: hypothetical protein ACQEXX_24195 [Bacillota bacterium]
MNIIELTKSMSDIRKLKLSGKNVIMTMTMRSNVSNFKFVYNPVYSSGRLDVYLVDINNPSEELMLLLIKRWQSMRA